MGISLLIIVLGVVAVVTFVAVVLALDRKPGGTFPGTHQFDGAHQDSALWPATHTATEAATTTMESGQHHHHDVSGQQQCAPDNSTAPTFDSTCSPPDSGGSSFSGDAGGG